MVLFHSIGRTAEHQPNELEKDRERIMARYKTGEKAPKTATYYFDGYVKGPPRPEPTPEEKQIQLSTGEVFPPIRSTERGAYWRD